MATGPATSWIEEALTVLSSVLETSSPSETLPSELDCLALGNGVIVSLDAGPKSLPPPITVVATSDGLQTEKR